MAFNVLLNVSNVLFPLVTAPYVARVLQPEGVGLFNFANTFASYFALVAALGIPTYGVREVAKCGDDEDRLNVLVSEIFSINVLSTLVTSMIFVAAISLIPQMRENLLFFLVAGIVVYSKPFSVEWYFQGRERFGFITMRSLIVRLVGILGLFIFVHDKDDLFIYLLLSVFSTILSQVWNYVMMVKSGVRPRFVLNGFRQHMRPLLILFSSSIAISIYTVLDTVMLGLMSSYSEVAFYNSATHISRSFLAVVTSLSIVAMPRLSYYLERESWEDINALIKKSLSIVSFTAIPITFGILCVAPDFIPLFLGDAFCGAVVPLQIMSLVIIAIGFNNLTGVQILVGLGYDKLFLRAVLAGTVSNFLMNLLLIPGFGSIGASISSVVAEILVLIVAVYYTLSHAPVRLSGLSDIGKSLVSALLFLPVAILCHRIADGWGFVLAMVVSCPLVYLVAQYLLGNGSWLLVREILARRRH